MITSLNGSSGPGPTWMSGSPSTWSWPRTFLGTSSSTSSSFITGLAAIGHVMTDLPGRLRGLGQTLDALDPDWAIDFARTGGQRTVTFRPKHSASHIISPISFRPIIREDRLPPDAAAAIRRSRDFGLDSQVSMSRGTRANLTRPRPGRRHGGAQ